MILKTYCPGMMLLAALAAQAQTLTYSNSITVPGGNPGTEMAFNIPQFDPADEILTSVTVAMYSTFQNQFTYNGLLASGELTYTPTNSLSFLYNGSDVLAQENAGGFTFTAGLPTRGQASTPASPLALEGQTIFSDAPDLANFTGADDVPLSAEYYFLPTVTWTSGTVTWTAEGTGTMAAVVTYDFETVPEPSVMSMTCLGGVAMAFANIRRWRKRVDFAWKKFVVNSVHG